MSITYQTTIPGLSADSGAITGGWTPTTRHLPVYALQVVREGSVKAATGAIAGPADAASIFETFIGHRDREYLVSMLLDTRMKILGLNVVSIGSLNASLCHPREVFKPALLLNAAAMIVAHNHPSGDAAPSREDLALHTRLKEVGALIGIAVLDHLIIGAPGHFVSIKESYGG